MRRTVAFAQGLTYAVGGAWPLLHLRSFEAVTGPKLDEWLERSVAGLLVAIGIAETHAARRDEVTSAIAVLGAGSAATLGAVSAWYAARGRIRKVYLADAAIEVAFLVGWALSAATDRRPRLDAR